MLPAADVTHSTERNRIETSPTEIRTTSVTAELVRTVSDKRPPLEQDAFGPTIEEQLAALGLNADWPHLDRPLLDRPRLDRPAAGSKTTAQTNRSAPPARSDPLNVQASAESSVSPFSDRTTGIEVAENSIENRSTIETGRRQIASTAAMSSNVAISGPAEPVTTDSNVNSPAARALIRLDAAADTNSTAGLKDQAPQKEHATLETPEQGTLVLGPLKNHPVGRLLAGYQSHVQSGNLPALIALFSSKRPRQGQRHGSESVTDYYRTLFQRSSHRSVDLRVLRVQREGAGWWVETELNFNITANLSRERITNGRVQFHIQPDPGGLKIVAIEY